MSVSFPLSKEHSPDTTVSNKALAAYLPGKNHNSQQGIPFAPAYHMLYAEIDSPARTRCKEKPDEGCLVFVGDPVGGRGVFCGREDFGGGYDWLIQSDAVTVIKPVERRDRHAVYTFQENDSTG